MAKYSVAAAKDGLSRLIDKALQGEEVIITRRGEPTVELRVVQSAKCDHRTMEDWLTQRRNALPRVEISSVELKRLEEEDYRY